MRMKQSIFDIQDKEGRMKVYLAGKIEPGDWRSTIVDSSLISWREEEAIQFFDQNIFREREKSIFNRFSYCGPYLWSNARALSAKNKAAIRYTGLYYSDICAFLFTPTIQEDVLLEEDLAHALSLKKDIFMLISSEHVKEKRPLSFEQSQVITGYGIFTDAPQEALFECLRNMGAFCDSEMERLFWMHAKSLLPDLIPQFSFGPYALDFADLKAKVAIEIDGQEFHSSREQRAHDAKRDRYLMKHGWRVLRFTGAEIHLDPTACALEARDIIAG